MNGFFITGTDTNVGKTVCTALLLATLRKKGYKIFPMKPIQTGCSTTAPDLNYIIKINDLEVPKKLLSLMAPFCFKPPCSPHLAAEMEGRPIQIKDIIPKFKMLKKYTDSILVEGAGGILVPINHKENMLDLIQEINLPVILVSRPGLGTINHTLLSLEALNKREISIAGIIFVHTEKDGSDFTEDNNKKIISKIGKTRILGTISYESTLDKKNPDSFSKINKKTHDEINAIVKGLIYE